MKLAFPITDIIGKELYLGLYKLGIKEEVNFIFATESRVISSYLRKNDVNFLDMRNELKSLEREKYRKMSITEKQKLLKLYNKDVNLLTFSDPFLFNKNLDRKLTRILTYIEIWNKFFSKYKPDFALCSDGRESYLRTYILVATHLKIKLVFTNGSSVFATRLFYSNNVFLTDWIKFDKYQNLTLDDKNRINDFITQTTKYRPVIGGKRDGIFSSKRILSALRYYWFCIIKEHNESPYHNAYYSFQRSIVPYFNRLKSKGYYDQPNKNEKYFFLPLHVPFDSQIILRAPLFIDQYKFIKICSDSLPDGYKLYVKEHPHMMGQIPNKTLEKIKQLPNIKLIYPLVNAHKLIKSSCGILTINSDVGFEALLYSKPVMTFAQPFYSGFGLTMDLKCFEYKEKDNIEVYFNKDSLTDLKSKITDSLNFKPDKEKFAQFLNSVYHSSYEGYFYLNAYLGKYNLDKKNIKNIIKSLKIELTTNNDSY